MASRTSTGRALVAAVAGALALAACGQQETAFADLPPREIPDGVDALAEADGWTVTDGGILAEAGDTFTLLLPAEDTPADVTYHLDRVDPDGTVVETVDLVGVSVPAGGAPTETITLPDEPDAHYTLFAEVMRDDGTFVVYRDWLYAR